MTACCFIISRDRTPRPFHPFVEDYCHLAVLLFPPRLFLSYFQYLSLLIQRPAQSSRAAQDRRRPRITIPRSNASIVKGQSIGNRRGSVKNVAPRSRLLSCVYPSERTSSRFICLLRVLSFCFQGTRASPIEFLFTESTAGSSAGRVVSAKQRSAPAPSPFASSCALARSVGGENKGGKSNSPCPGTSHLRAVHRSGQRRRRDVVSAKRRTPSRRRFARSRGSFLEYVTLRRVPVPSLVRGPLDRPTGSDHASDQTRRSSRLALEARRLDTSRMSGHGRDTMRRDRSKGVDESLGDVG